MKKYRINRKVFFALLIILNFPMMVLAQNDIVLLKDLIHDAAEATWNVQNNQALTFGMNAGLNRVVRGAKLGGVNGSGYSPNNEFFIDESISADTIDVRFQPTLGREDVDIRGAFYLQLPNRKRIQLELLYDLFLDIQGNPSPADFFVEVFVQNLSAPSGWEKSGEIHPRAEASASMFSTIRAIRDERFTTHIFVANLSRWAGQDVRLDLVSKIPAAAITPQRGRWVQAKLIGSNIDYQLGPGEPVPQQLNANKRLFNLDFQKPARMIIQGTPTVDYLGSPSNIVLSSVRNYPDTGVSTAVINNTKYAYFHGLMEFEEADAVTPSDEKYHKRGTMIFENATNLYSISVNDLQVDLLRGVSAGSIAPASSGTPFLTIKPHHQEWAKWDNWYTGAQSTIVANNGGGNRVHAFVHVEDRSIDGVSENDGLIRYYRIGYARSKVNSGTDFDLNNNEIYLMADDGISNPTPIIECFLTEQQMQNGVSAGVGVPSVIKSGQYYYMFYTRWIANEDMVDAGGWPPYTHAQYGIICAARALESEVISSDYASSGHSNPWKKWYDGAWNEDGRGGLSTAVITDATPDEWRAFSKVLYDDDMGGYFMICKGECGFYLYFKISDLSSPNWGTGMLIENMEPANQIHYPSLIGQNGDDKNGSVYYKLYYAYDTDTTGGGHYMRRREIDIQK